MDRLPSPTITPLAERWIRQSDSRLNLRQLALLRTVDGHRNVVELESFARALGLHADELNMLRRAGLLTFEEAGASA